MRAARQLIRDGAIGLILALLLGFMALPAAGAVYYVAPTGNDAHPGTLAQPWRTIGKAAATLTAGDTVFIRAGTYPEWVMPQNSGAPGQYITYTAYPGETVTIDGAGLPVPQYSGLIDLALKNYIRVSGLRVLNSSDQGIQADGSSNIIIENNYTYNTVGSGIGVWGSQNVIVAGNEVERACTGIYNECISVGVTDNFEVRNNYVHHAYPNLMKEGICAKDGSANGKVYGNRVHDTLVGIYVDAQARDTYNIQVYGNLVYHNGGQGLHYYGGNGIALASEVGGSLENIQVFNNISHGNYWHGIQVSACCIASHPMTNIRIINNTFYNNGKEWGCGIAFDNPQALNAVLRNNICSQNSGPQITLDAQVNPANCQIDHNLIDGPSDVYGTAYVEGNPRFVDAAQGDFRLRAGSPAIDRGSAVAAPSADYRGVPRPQGAGFDMGAYEYQPKAAALLLLLD
jgi:nitrous oxidase accessory protein NosD